MDVLGRYYTSEAISTLLINNLETKAPKRILDLGVGDASLTLAAYAKWSKAKYFGTEIEKNKAIAIEKKLSFLKVFNCDTLHPYALSRFKIKFGSIDIAICNPPYTKIHNKASYNNLFESIGCLNFRYLRRITSEIVFFAHNLKYLKDDGELAIIVSDSLITGKEFQIFRETILSKFDVRRIIQLPDKIFNKTEARTHILFISKTKTNKKYCEILMSSAAGILTDEVQILKKDLVKRMDFQFHKFNISKGLKYITLNEIGAIIKRGRFSYKELKESKLAYFHSVHFKEKNINIEFTKLAQNIKSDYLAEAGDILMCRVGKRIVGRVAMIKSGTIIISDCIYKIKVPKKFQQIVLNSLLSQQGKDWLHANAHGVCSQVISKSDLEIFPLYCM